MAITIRPANAEDETDVVALWQACGLVIPSNDPAADFRFASARPSSEILVGEEPGGRVVGSVMVGHDGHRGWIYYLASASAARKRGVGRAMVAAAETWLRDRGVVKVQLLVRQSNATVVGFYERLGFKTEPRIVLSKRLDRSPG